MGLCVENIAPVVGILDVQKLAEPYKLGGKLIQLVKALEIPERGRSLHNGGNDAHYSLRALLAFACEKQHGRELDGAARIRQGELPALFRSPPPDPTERNRRARRGPGSHGCHSIDWNPALDGAVLNYLFV